LADVQKENGYVKLANEILENIARFPLNGTQHRIVDVIWRYTYGFNRKDHELSEGFISKATNIHRKQVQRELNELISCKMVLIAKEATFNTSRKLRFNKDYEQWVVTKKLPGNEKEVTAKKLPDNQIDTHTGSESVTSPGSELATQERQYLKTILKKEYSLEIENFRNRYTNFLPVIDEYLDILRTTRASGKISDSVIVRVYEEMLKFSVIVVKAACLTVIHSPALHSKKENYFYGIMRNTRADEAAEKVRKYETLQQEHSKPNGEYQRLKELLNNGSSGIQEAVR